MIKLVVVISPAQSGYVGITTADRFIYDCNGMNILLDDRFRSDFNLATATDRTHYHVCTMCMSEQLDFELNLMKSRNKSLEYDF